MDHRGAAFAGRCDNGPIRMDIKHVAYYFPYCHLMTNGTDLPILSW